MRALLRTFAVTLVLGAMARCTPPAPVFSPCRDGGVCSGGLVCCRDGTCRGLCPVPDGGSGGGRGGGLATGGGFAGGSSAGGQSGGAGGGTSSAGGDAGGSAAGGDAGGSAGGDAGGSVAGGGAFAGGAAGGGSMAGGAAGGSAVDAGCAPSESSCANGLDDDCDGQRDCADSDCDTRTCSDGSSCTVADRCIGTTCVGTGTCTTPPAPATCYGPGSCLADGGCGYTFRDDAGCDDADACTTNDRCTAGACRGTAVGCSSPPSCFAGPGTCNPSTGQCTYAGADAGTLCNDNNLCTQGDRCVDAGVCLGFPRCSFVDNPCLTGVCNPTTGVCGTGTNVANGTACTYLGFAGFGCPVTGTCQNGTCTGTSPPIACNDFNACTANDTCSGSGTCTGTTTTGACDDGNQCTANDTCATGSCVGTNRTGACNDSSPCTVNEVCTNGACGGGTPVAGLCDDANACTINDTCASGVCQGTNLPVMTQVGPSPEMRCCPSSFMVGVLQATDITSTPQHCGGCGIDCGGFLNFFGCVPTEGALTCGAPPSGRCACTGPSGMPAPLGSWVCSAAGVWVPQTLMSCNGGRLITAAGACPAYCAP
ncbi:MAG: hypothetical protein Q8L14_33670 [Myxococcales bacterium]|nr:hypothetical protein [Myxococcales bacterium]